MREKLLALGAKKLIVAGVAAAVLLGAVGVAAETGTFTGTTASPSPSASPTASPSPTPLPDANAGGKNVVQVINRKDGRLKVDGRFQLNRIPGPNAGPVNLALAYSQCTNCQTMALALQINLISTSANNVQPKNAATAVNVQCNGCVTVARAIQYNISVDDPTNVPPEVNRLAARIRAELARVKTSSNSLADAEAGFSAIVDQFRDLAAYLKQSRQQETAPTTQGATPMPSGTVEPSSTATPTETPSVSPSVS